tara:strand:+ start:608 stop:835 length:228 start_codon:yes stop_codon:yes gene_type:complete
MLYPSKSDVEHILKTKAGKLYPLAIIVGGNRALQDEFKLWADQHRPGCFDDFELWFEAAYTWIELNEDRLRKMMH